MCHPIMNTIGHCLVSHEYHYLSWGWGWLCTEGEVNMARSAVLEGRVKVVDVDGVEKCVNGIKWNTTVGELLNR